MARTGRGSWAAALALALALVGCDEGNGAPVICDRPATDRPVDFRGGTVEDGVYRSSDWDGDLLAFPGGAYYRIHHQLGEVPSFIELFVSFERRGVAEGSIAPASGNQAELKAIDVEALTVLNGTCTDYWLLVVAGR